MDLYWIPLGAGGHCVRVNGRVFEAIEAARQHRQRCDLYHAALVVGLDLDRYMIEVAPSPDPDEASRGVVATGPVGSRYIGLLRLFRYEVRCWRGGSIPDLGEAVDAPRRLTTDPQLARRLLDLITIVPRPVWGRDELKAGEMWNSNSVAAWLIASAGLQQTSFGRHRAVALPVGSLVSKWLGAAVHTTADTPRLGKPPLAARASDRQNYERGGLREPAVRTRNCLAVGIEPRCPFGV